MKNNSKTPALFDEIKTLVEATRGKIVDIRIVGDKTGQSGSLVEIKDCKVICNSLMVAEKFGKEHKNVLRDIQNLECSKMFRELNFELSSYKSQQGKELPMFEMTRDGFTFLAMVNNRL